MFTIPAQKCNLNDIEAKTLEAHDECCGCSSCCDIYERFFFHSPRCFGLDPAFLQSKDGYLWATQAQLILSTFSPPPLRFGKNQLPVCLNKTGMPATAWGSPSSKVLLFLSPCSARVRKARGRMHSVMPHILWWNASGS